MRQLEEVSASELRFPAGMGVLVVDDDSACLKLMENLLLKCHYRVTTTNRGKEALKILKENRNKFDIVISDVQMPDMDGIKLLQLVGLEMNIPVIMLSAHSDQKLVMEGIRNGACDYLVKPVRIQELQNIWQHVVRRNKSITLKRPAPSAVEIDRLKGKQRIEEILSGGDDEPETEEDDRDNEESNNKKPRLFWSVELHQKFVDAVNSLGLDKAYPKKILELMNIQGLTREKVASHLQKYRLYLRKVDEGSGQTGMNMIMNGYDDVHIDPFGGRYGVFRAYAGMNSSLSNPPTFGQLNTSAGLSIRDLASSPMLQTSQLQNSFGNFGGAIPSQGFPSHPQNVPTLMNAPPPPNSIFSSQNTIQFGNQVPPSNSWGSFGKQIPSSNSWGSFGNQVPSSNSWGNFVDPQPFQRNLFTANTSADVIAPPMSHAQSVQNDYFYGFPSGDVLKDSLPAPNNLNANAINTINFQGQSQTWQGQKPDNVLYSSNMPASDQNLSQNNTNIGVSPLLQLEGASTQFQQQNANLVEPSIKFDDFLLDDGKFMAGSSNASGGSEYLEDIVGSFLKQDNGGTAQAPGDDFDFDLFTS